MHYVIGSGPAGIACAYALVASGRKVTILDAGTELEHDREAVRASVALRDRDDWTWAEIDLLKTIVPKSGDVPQKRVYGSDYPYRSVPGATDIRYSTLNIRASYARGGLSNVWGGAILPYSADDIADWPISRSDLSHSYAEVMKIIPVTAQEDDLSDQFPLYTRSFGRLAPSRQITNLMRVLKKNRIGLSADGIKFGCARLAVDAAGQRENKPCIYCGYCLHGCPRDLIYSSRHSLNTLMKTGLVEYKAGVVVRSLEEGGGAVRINVVRRDGSSHRFEGERVFLGAGAINSTAILLRSLGMVERPVSLKDSQYYLFPMLQAKGVPRIAEERLHTLSQIFIEIFDRKISPHTIHLQVYGYNDHLSQLLANKLGYLKGIFPENALLGRLLLIQGYLHSSHSGNIVATLKRSGDADALFLEPSLNPATDGKIRQVLRKLASQAWNTHAMPLSPLLQITEPGRGFHIGGSFPMAAAPRPGQTDRMGRPHGMKRTHVVDATVFPSIPATTITLTAMANAYRIGREASRLEPRDSA